jgi:hypothetical protein
MPTTEQTKQQFRRHFIGGSDARIILGKDEKALLRLWREKRGEEAIGAWKTPSRVRLHLPPAPGSGAALCQGLRASSPRSNRPTGQPKRQERTQNWIKPGGKVRWSNPLSRRRGSSIERPEKLSRHSCGRISASTISAIIVSNTIFGVQFSSVAAFLGSPRRNSTSDGR